MNNRSGTANLGPVVSVRGSVVDIRFDKYWPPIKSLNLAYPKAYAEHRKLLQTIRKQLEK